MKYYVHAYADAERRLPDKEDTIEAENDDAAYSKAWDKYAEHKELYVERASAEILKEMERVKK